MRGEIRAEEKVVVVEVRGKSEQGQKPTSSRQSQTHSKIGDRRWQKADNRQESRENRKQTADMK
jgi:hypothetical protein